MDMQIPQGQDTSVDSNSLYKREKHCDAGYGGDKTRTREGFLFVCIRVSHVTISRGKMSG